MEYEINNKLKDNFEIQQQNNNLDIFQKRVFSSPFPLENNQNYGENFFEENIGQNLKNIEEIKKIPSNNNKNLMTCYNFKKSINMKLNICLNSTQSDIILCLSAIDNNLIATGSKNGEILIWDFNLRKCIMRYNR